LGIKQTDLNLEFGPGFIVPFSTGLKKVYILVNVMARAINGSWVHLPLLLPPIHSLWGLFRNMLWNWPLWMDANQPKGAFHSYLLSPVATRCQLDSGDYYPNPYPNTNWMIVS
jgi:hypothetical protein